MTLDGLPILLLEIGSDTHDDESVQLRLHVQAACLVRLGTLLTKSRDFLVKAIYIGTDLCATEYTFFESNAPGNQTVIVPFFCRIIRH
jgi:hypothetical protein